MILDGFGYSTETRGNAILAARTPSLDRLFADWPTVLIGASGLDVGLPDGQMGNSEVGHTNMGAGRIVYQDLTAITKDIQDGVFFDNEVLTGAMKKAVETGKAVHLYGLLSDGGVHSHITHLFALIDMAKRQGVEKLYIHCFMDGRDVDPMSGKGFIEQLQAKCAEAGLGRIATISGRYYAMDRDKHYDRIQKAYDAMVCGEGVQNPDPVDAMQKSYDAGVTDEFVIPVVVDPEGTIKEGDSVIFYDFRPDRARQITRAFADHDLTGLDRRFGCFPVNYVCFTVYDATIPNVSVAFPPKDLKNTLGEYLSDNGLTQLRIAETEKYAHVTFFFNGGREEPYDGEDRILVKSPGVATYDLQPEMSAYPVTDKVLEAIASDKYDAIVLNFANCDMVGHTGVFEAAVKAVEAVDTCVGRIADAMLAKGGVILLTADHGNADKMLDEKGHPFTAHTTNPVRFTTVGRHCHLREGGRLADIAPTMLQILGLPVPPEMDGKSLIDG